MSYGAAADADDDDDDNDSDGDGYLAMKNSCCVSEQRWPGGSVKWTAAIISNY